VIILPPLFFQRGGQGGVVFLPCASALPFCTFATLPLSSFRPMRYLFLTIASGSEKIQAYE
jgi:hypothetical protein